MAVAITKENFFWHKLHSLSGIIPVGFYMLQHLILNGFSLAGPDKYNSVSGFFYSMPPHILWAIEIGVIWLPLLFHAIYGMFITSRGEMNSYFSSKYRWPQARMYTFQRYTGLFVFVFLCYHVTMTTVNVKLNGENAVNYAAMGQHLAQYGYLILVFYALGVFAASYHFCYGVWNFCIRWGITISERAQNSIRKFSFGLFIVVTALGWLALLGFFLHQADVTGVV